MKTNSIPVLLGVCFTAIGCTDVERGQVSKEDTRPHATHDSAGQTPEDAASTSPLTTDMAPSSNDTSESLRDLPADFDAATTCSLTIPAASPLPAEGMHQEWTIRSCAEEPCLCSTTFEEDLVALARCDAIQIGYRKDFGATAWRARGVQNGKCIIDVGTEMDGIVTVHRCTRPVNEALCCSGSTPQKMDDSCTLLGTCDMIAGGPSPCSQGDLVAPMCPGETVSCQNL